MLDENLIATLEQSLRQTRNAQNRLMARLREVEYESERLREEIDALENSASQTESAIDSLLVTMRSSGRRPQTNTSAKDEIGTPVRETPPVRHETSYPPASQSPSRPSSSVSYFGQNRGVPLRTNNIEAISHRFADRTITQACTLLLREAGKPLHVNELYNLLVAGGMQFKGNNPTISIAVSLNRNRRFRKVEPGTFDLIMRDASRVAS
jgi:hypothetical protein